MHNLKLMMLVGALTVGSSATVFHHYYQPQIVEIQTAAAPENSDSDVIKASLNLGVRDAVNVGEHDDQVIAIRNIITNRQVDEFVDGSPSSGMASEMTVERAAKKAFSILKDAAISNNKEVLKELSKVDPYCEWCDPFYATVRSNVGSIDQRSDVRAFLAKTLVQSGRPENVKKVIDLMAQAGLHPENRDNPSVYANAFKDGPPLRPEEIDQIGAELESPNPYLREAAISILTEQGTLNAAERLYQNTVESGDRSGYYREGMGLGFMVPEPEALGYLEGLVNQRDQYSHLAVKALLNYGQEGLERVVQLFSASSDLAMDRKMLQNAVGHIKRTPDMLAYLTTLAASGSPAIKEVAKAALKEHDIDENNQTREIEKYNEHFDPSKRRY